MRHFQSAIEKVNRKSKTSSATLTFIVKPIAVAMMIAILMLSEGELSAQRAAEQS